MIRLSKIKTCLTQTQNKYVHTLCHINAQRLGKHRPKQHCGTRGNHKGASALHLVLAAVRFPADLETTHGNGDAGPQRRRSRAEDDRPPSSMLIIWFYLPSFVQIESMNFTQRVNITQCFQCFLTLKIVCMLISLLALSGDFCRGGSMVFSFWSSVNRYSMLHHNHSSMQFPPLPTN